jgi:YfiH family protein
MRVQPSAQFEWVHAPAGPALVCRALQRVARHLFTTRKWRLGGEVAATDEAWAEVAAGVGANPMNLARMHQVHGAAVTIATRGAGASRPSADVAITCDADVALAVQAADCVPLLIADRRHEVVAAVHAGWRGLAALAPQAAVRALTRLCGSQPSDLIAAVGPSIGACCYEVGPDVREALMRAGPSNAMSDKWFFDRPQPSAMNPSMPALSPGPRTDRWFLDCWSVTHDQLAQSGVRDIHIAAWCTASHPDVLCSYRRDGKGAGRIAGVIRVGEPMS